MAENKRPESMERITTEALAQSFIHEQVEALQEQIGDKKVLLALSGGVDSSVVAALLIKAVGKQLVCVHVNHGLLRKGEPEQVVKVFRDEMDANLIYVDAVDRFLDKLAGVDDPETKRKIIGKEFIEVFAEEAAKQSGRGIIPQVSWAGDFAGALDRAIKTELPLFMYETGEREALDKVLSENSAVKSAAIVTGPEGGFEAFEAQLAKIAGLHICSMGERILRCETAPVVALTAAMYATGNLS